MMHELSLRVYYEDTDAGGVVYYANYLKYAERARTELLRAQQIDQSVLAEEEGIFFVVRKVDADYKRPARLDDTLIIRTEVVAVKSASVQLAQTIMLEDATELVDLRVTIACVAQSEKGFAPARMPDAVKKVFTG